MFIQILAFLTHDGILEAQQVPTWSVSDVPLLSIGDSPNDPFYQLDRVSAAVWLGPKGLAIANHGYEVRYYDVEGRHRSTTGRSGDGPGEFRSLTWLGAGTDSTVVAYDARLQRVSVLSHDGTFLRSFQLNRPDHGVGPKVAGILGDGSLLTLWAMRPVVPPNGGLSEWRVRLVLYSPSGSALNVVGEGLGGEAFLYNVPGRGNAIRRAPFSPTPRYAAQGDHIYDTDGTSYSVRIRDTQGRQVAVLGDVHRRVAITESVKSAFLRDTLRLWPSSDRPRLEAAFRNMMVHEYLPLVVDMLVDDAGYVWLRGRDAAGPASHWDVFSPTGSSVRVDLPPHRAVLDIAGGVVVLLQAGQFEQDIVSVYPIDPRRE